MAAKLKVTYSDGRTEEVLAGPKAQVALERQYNVGLTGADQRIEYVYYLAWAALHFAGREGRNFDEFLSVLSEVEAVEEGAVVPPTQPDQEPDTSSN